LRCQIINTHPMFQLCHCLRTTQVVCIHLMSNSCRHTSYFFVF
jgi:hypothetical protein